MIFFARIENGKLHLKDKQSYDNFISSKKDTPKVIIKIEKWRNTRSNQANRYYWGYVLNEIARETGYTPEEIHELMKRKFLPKRFITIKGREYETEPTTTKSDSLEFMEYVESIKVWASQELSISWIDYNDYASAI